MASASEDLNNILKDNPLGELSRKERTMLLLVSIITISISRAGLVPTKVVGFGVEFSNIDHSGILWLLTAIVLYFMITFISYAVPDFLSWQVRYNKFWFDMADDEYDYEDDDRPGPKPSAEYVNFWQKYSKAQGRYRKATLLRIFLDLAIPTAVGSTAIIFAVAAT